MGNVGIRTVSALAVMGGLLTLASVASAQFVPIARFRRPVMPVITPACRAAIAAASMPGTIYVMPCLPQTGDELRAAVRDAAIQQGGEFPEDIAFTMGPVERCAVDRVGGQPYEVTLGEGATAVRRSVIVRKNGQCYTQLIPPGIPGLSA